MLRMLAIVVLGSSLASAISAPELSAQAVIVVYDHGVHTPEADRVWYRVAGKSRDAKLEMPQPAEFVVKQGQAACIQVTNGNPLLYTYGVDTATVQTSSKSQTDFITAFGAVIAGLTPKVGEGLRTSSRAIGAAPDDYTGKVNQLYLSLQTIEKEVDASDEGSFDEGYAAFLTEYKTAQDRNTAADKAWTGLDESARSATQFARFAQAQVWEAISGWKTRWDAANGENGKAMCFAVSGSSLKLALTIKELRKRVGKDHGTRTLTPNLAFTVESRASERVYFSPGFLLSAYTQDKASFSVNSTGVVDSTSDHDPDISPALFAHYRMASSPFFATFGVGESGEAPAFFLGFAFRDDFLGTAVSLGAGLSFLRTPVRLTKGGQGQPIPVGAGNLTDLIEKKYRGGLGLVFSITGLSLERMDSKQAK